MEFYHFIDTHCHLNAIPLVTQLTDELQRAQHVGVEKIIIPAVVASDFAKLLTWQTVYPAVEVALGLHPIAIHRHSADSLQQLAYALQHYRAQICAIGEIGLDNWIDNPLMDRQQEWLQQQLLLALDFELPVILHSRRSHHLLYPILKRYALTRTGVIHGFAGSFEQARNFIRLGYYIGVGGIITYPRANKTRQCIAQLPLSALLLETDSPDMPVMGYQGEPNRPERLVDIFKALCLIRSEAPSTIMQSLYTNSQRLFAL